MTGFSCMVNDYQQKNQEAQYIEFRDVWVGLDGGATERQHLDRVYQSDRGANGIETNSKTETTFDALTQDILAMVR